MNTTGPPQSLSLQYEDLAAPDRCNPIL